MRILRAHVENYRKIRLVEIDPQSDVIQITGRNAQGKSSFLDGIAAALEKASVAKLDPVRKGARRARVVLSLGTGENVEIVVTRDLVRREGPDGAISTVPTLKIEPVDGETIKKPADYMDALVGAFAMDPLAFMEASPKEQADTLKGFVSGFDFEANAKTRQDAFSKRTDENREAKRLRAQADAIVVPISTPSAPIDVEALEAKIDEAAQHNANVAALRAHSEGRGERIASLNRQSQEATDRAAALRAEAQREEDRAKELFAQAVKLETEDSAPIPDESDIGALRIERDKARAINSAVARRAQRLEIEAKATAAEDESSRLTKLVEDCTSKALKAIADADMPVEGLSIEEDQVLLNGLSLKLASSAEQIRTSVAIAMKLNPKLRVIRIKDGDKLDDDALAIISEMAAGNDFQIWMEMVRGASAGAIVIEDGEVSKTLV